MDVRTSLEVLQVLDGATAGYSKEYAPERIVRLREVMEQLDTELEKAFVIQSSFGGVFFFINN
jgi:hypothetical protein